MSSSRWIPDDACGAGVQVRHLIEIGFAEKELKDLKLYRGKGCDK